MQRSGNDHKASHSVYIQTLDTLLKMAGDHPSHDTYVKQAISQLNKLGRNQDRDEKLGKLMDKLFKIEFKLVEFKNDEVLNEQVFQDAVITLKMIIQFQKHMMKFETSDQGETDEKEHFIKLIRNNEFLILLKSYNNYYAIDFFDPEDLLRILEQLGMDLMRLLNDSDQSLLEHILKNKRDLTVEHLPAFKKILENKGIKGVEVTSCKSTINQLFKNKFKIDYSKKSKIYILEGGFQTFFIKNEDLKSLKLTTKDQKELVSLINNPHEFLEEFIIEGKPVIVKGHKHQIEVIINGHTKNLRCCYKPQNPRVQWKIFKKIGYLLINLTPKQSQRITQSLQSRNSLPLQLKIDEEYIEVVIDQQLNVLLNSNQTLFGCLVWVPSYKQPAPLPSDADQQSLDFQSINNEKLEPERPSLPRKEQKEYIALVNMQQYFPANILSDHYYQNGMNIKSDHPQICALLEEFIKNGIKQILVTYLGGNQCLTGSKKQPKYNALVVKRVNQFSHLHKLSEIFKAQENRPQQTYSVWGLKNVKNSAAFIEKLIEYLIKKEDIKCQEQIYKLDKNQIEILDGLSNLIPIQIQKLTGTCVNVKGDKKSLECINDILTKQKIKEKIDMMDELQFLQKEDRCYMINFKLQGTITKLMHPTFEVESEPEHFGKFLKKLYEAKEKLQQIKKMEKKQSATDFVSAKYVEKYESLRKLEGVELKVAKTGQQQLLRVDITFTNRVKPKVQALLERIKKEIAQQNITVQQQHSRKLTITGISSEMAFKICSALESSQQSLALTTSKGGGNSVTIKKGDQNKDQYSFELKSSSQVAVKRFQEDVCFVQMHTKEYRTQMWKFSIQKMEQYLKYTLSYLKVSKQTTTKEATAYKTLRGIFSDEIQQRANTSRDEMLAFLEKEMIQHLQKRFRQNIRFQAYQNFKKSIQSTSIKLFEIFLDRIIKEYGKSRLVDQYNKEIEDTMKPQVQKLQYRYEVEKKVVDAKELASFERSARILCCIYFTLNLPIVEHLPIFRSKFDQSRLMIVKTGTGSGKSTVLPPYILGLGYKKIFVTQPRRFPCQKICQRIEATNGNGVVGFRLGGGVSKNPYNDLIYITDGLLKEIIYQNQDFLKDVEVIMLDEVHQETKNIDLIILLLSKVMDKYPKLKVIFCSATVNDALVHLFDNKYPLSTFEVNINSFPIREFQITNTSLLEKVNELGKTLNKNQQMLVFFPSVKQVEHYKKIFEEKYKKKAYGLYGNQSPMLQEEAMRNGQIIFSNNVAETSLTFQTLKIVVDSQKTRIQMYDIIKKMTISKQIPASKSSIKQRKGRLGRVQTGDYYYMVYNDDSVQDEHNLSELDRVQLSNVCFELFAKYKNWNSVQRELLRLKVHDLKDFKQKISEVKVTFSEQNNLFFESGRDGMSNKCKKQILPYGSIGNICFNLSLYKSIERKCFENMAAVVAFAMIGVPIISTVLKQYSGDRSRCSGDLEVIGEFVLGIANRMKLSSIKLKDVFPAYQQLPNVKNYKSMGSLLPRILVQMKKFYDMKPHIVSSTKDWNVVNAIIGETFFNNVFFNRSMIGGNNSYYQKIIPEMVYYPNRPIDIVNDIQFELNQDSPIYTNRQRPPFIVALSCTVNPFSNCVLSLCCKINSDIRTKIGLELKEHNNAIGNFKVVKEDAIYNQHIGPNGTLMIDRNGDRISIKGSFAEVLSKYHVLNNSLVNNWTTNLTDWLQNVIKRRFSQSERSIREQKIKQNFKQLNLRDLFKPLTTQFQKLYNTEIRWRNGGVVEINKASNFVLTIFNEKIQGFLSWFVNCQIILPQNLKIKPEQINIRKPIFKDQAAAKQILNRVNQIVDPDIDFAILKSWVSGVYDNVHIRVYRMIAVCWILTNQYDCSIKGGFVRDWVINGEVNLPGGTLNDLLVKCNYTNFYKMRDQRHSPSDIDVDLSTDYPFDYEGFVKTMNKLGIKVTMKDDGWRYLLAFDLGQPTGGFTADLIHPYCYISHDLCDFDVNLMYIKGGYKNQVGMKIPLKLRLIIPKALNTNEVNVSIQELIVQCRSKRMRTIRTNLGQDRVIKFQNRGWNIESNILESVIHPSFKSSYFAMTHNQLRIFDSKWCKEILDGGRYELIEAMMIKNAAHDAGYQAAKVWIANQSKNLNQIRLYHGTSEEGARGIADLGFDSRYYGAANGQVFGRGAYLADDPKYSDKYNQQKERFMLILDVALGNKEVMTESNTQKQGPAKGFHSIYVTARAPNMEYIVDRWGQARPVAIIKYRLI